MWEIGNILLILMVSSKVTGRAVTFLQRSARIIRYKGQPIRDIVDLSEKLRDMTLWKLVFLDEIRDSWEHDEAASEMQGHLYSYYTRTPGPGVSLWEYH